MRPPAGVAYHSMTPGTHDQNEHGEPILVASHRRSGTHLMIDLLRRQFAPCDARAVPGRPPADLYLPLDRFKADAHWPITEQSAQRVLRRAQRPILKAHLLPSLEEVAPGARAYVADLIARSVRIYCVRDGRRVMCSYRLYKTAGAQPMREFLRERVNGKSRAAAWAQHVRAWLAQPRVHPIPYESVVADPKGTVEQLADLLEQTPRWRQPTLPRRHRSVAEVRLRRLIGRWESTAILGKAPANEKGKRWQDVFDEEDRRFFHEEAGDVLIELGYEPDDSWVSEPAFA